MATNFENHSSQVGANEAKTGFSKLLERVKREREITITRDGSAVARLAPAKPKPTLEQRRAPLAALRAIGNGNSLAGLTNKDQINEGRR